MWMNLKNTLLNGESSAQWSIYSLIPVTDTFWNLKLIYDKKISEQCLPMVGVGIDWEGAQGNL